MTANKKYHATADHKFIVNLSLKEKFKLINGFNNTTDWDDNINDLFWIINGIRYNDSDIMSSNLIHSWNLANFCDKYCKKV